MGGEDGLSSCWNLRLSVEQKLSGSHKALVEMQDIVAELLRNVPREHPATKVRGYRAQEGLWGTVGVLFPTPVQMVFLFLFSFHFFSFSLGILIEF